MNPISFPQFSHYAQQGYAMVPLAQSRAADTETPISLYQRFAHLPNSFLLESVEGGENWARYSFIGFEPCSVFTFKNGQGNITGRDGQVVSLQGDPATLLRPLLAAHRSPVLAGLPRLTGGAVGFFAYDMVRYLEKLPDTCLDDQQVPDCHLLFCDRIVAYDHLRQEIILMVNVPTRGEEAENYQQGIEQLERLGQLVQAPADGGFPANQAAEREAEASMSQGEFVAMVQEAKAHIVDGDIFQVVLSRRLRQRTDINPLTAYRALRRINPSPYMYYLNFADFQVVGASPEMLVRVDNRGRVETCPIAGTRPRGATAAEDQLLADQLLQDAKEVAEHMMLVDLGRNDIGRVAAFGSVTVNQLKKIEHYSHVMHIVSNVSGELATGKDALDALYAVFPAGTLTGAPKVKAMELIDYYEKHRRGIYGGAAGYLGFDGSMDLCIIIRTFFFQDGWVSMQSGGGIVYDSVPSAEFAEAENKVQALRQALQKAGEAQ